MFCDKVSVKLKAGNGGDGIVSFLHEKYKEFGGPDGGDGGRGGDIILKIQGNLNTLHFFKTNHDLRAEDGERGKKRKSRGKNGQSLIIEVPRGTVVIDEKSGRKIVDMSEIEEFVLAKGGDGGFGNAHFVSSTRQAPEVAELGEPGEEIFATFELKMIADVGLVGLPNVGKSTFLSVVSAARPKIADYEFTTLIPNLGVIEPKTFGAERGFVAADIPGIIEGASAGKGLGIEFLRHIERNKVLVHFLDATHEDLKSDYLAIRNEIKNYKSTSLVNLGNDLWDLPEIVVVNKIDAVSLDNLKEKIKRVQAVVKSKIIPISSIAHKNIEVLIHEIEAKLIKENNKKQEESVCDFKEFTIKDVVSEDIFEVKKEKNFFLVAGKKIEKFAIRTNFSNKHGIARFRDILKRTGIDKELRRQGAKEGDKIKVAGKEIIF
ncbi:MAG: GTPase ObgE [Patescibacteria group bacterium]|nr:GTPase ObgE [Patescibacteria group bacterium]